MRAALIFPQAKDTEQTADIAIYWEEWDSSQAISLPALVHDNIEQIRAEHAAWAYDMAFLSIRGKELQAWLKQKPEELSTWWTSLLYERHPKMTPSLYTIYKLRALEIFLQEKKIRHLEIIGAASETEQAIQSLCQAMQITVTSKDTQKPSQAAGSGIRRLYDTLPSMIRASLRFLHWLWKVRRYLPHNPDSLSTPANRETAVIMTYFPNIDTRQATEGHFYSRYWEKLHLLLNKEHGLSIRWLFVRFPSPQGTLQQCTQWRDAFRKLALDGCSFDYLEEFLSANDIWRSWRRFCHISRQAHHIEKDIRQHFHFAHSRLNFWQFMAHDWHESFHGWRALERCLQQCGIHNYVTKAGPQRWYLFPLENCPWERMLTYAVHSAGTSVPTPVYGAQHSVIRPTDFRYFDDPRTFSHPDCQLFQPNRIVANGRSALQQWQSAGIPDDRLGMVEALRYLYLAEGSSPKASSPCTASQRLLVVTSFFADETFYHARVLAQAIQAGLLNHFEIIVKPHPYLPIKDHMQTLLGEQISCLHFADGPIGDQLLPGTIVWASNSTTVALEAALYGLPLMVMRPCGDFDLCPLQNIPELIRIANLADVQYALHSGVLEKALPIAKDYLCLDTALQHWQELLHLQDNVTVHIRKN